MKMDSLFDAIARKQIETKAETTMKHDGVSAGIALHAARMEIFASGAIELLVRATKAVQDTRARPTSNQNASSSSHPPQGEPRTIESESRTARVRDDVAWIYCIDLEQEIFAAVAGMARENGAEAFGWQRHKYPDIRHGIGVQFPFDYLPTAEKFVAMCEQGKEHKGPFETLEPNILGLPRLIRWKYVQNTRAHDSWMSQKKTMSGTHEPEPPVTYEFRWLDDGGCDFETGNVIEEESSSGSGNSSGSEYLGSEQ